MKSEEESLEQEKKIAQKRENETQKRKIGKVHRI